MFLNQALKWFLIFMRKDERQWSLVSLYKLILFTFAYDSENFVMESANGQRLLLPVLLIL